MEEKKKSNIVVVFLIIAIVIILIMAYSIYKLYDAEQTKNSQITKLNSEITKLKQEKQSLQQTLDSIQNNLNNINASTSLDSKTDTELAEETAKEFINAVNQKDWNTVEKLSNSQIVSALQEYNISNMKIDDYSYYTHRDNFYCYFVDYDMEYEGSTNPKDFSLGSLFIVDKVDEKFIVSSPFATGT